MSGNRVKCGEWQRNCHNNRGKDRGKAFGLNWINKLQTIIT